LFRLFLVFTTGLVLLTGAIAQSIELKNNSFYIDGQKYFVKGIGYEVGATPGEVPWDRTFNPELMHFDIQRILLGGFNTIRTWAPLTDEELTLIAEYDLKIIMGIWIDPHADFSDETFVAEAKVIVNNVLSYSKNYDNIIAYLIMNEPLPETIAEAGYDATVELWTELIDIIHEQHPNRPVSISNTSNGTYIDPAVFDYSGYAVYIYNPVTVNYLHRYRDYVAYLQRLNVPGRPLILTEYGLSVSPVGPGNWGYGGNSLAEQEEGNLHMYKALVDGGAAGSCMFIYSDGWWKAGNEFVHDGTAEEWFGMVEYADLDDDRGDTRPVWDAVKAYQSAIITEPKSSELYTNKVPLEIFPNNTINSIEIILDSQLIYQSQLMGAYFQDSILFEFQQMKDAVLVFNCYDAEQKLIKSEEKNILIAPTIPELPTINISIENEDYWQDGVVSVKYHIVKSTAFISDTKVDYIFYRHLGFEYGEKFQRTLSGDNEITFIRDHIIGSNVNVFTVGAAFDVAYGDFRKRIVNQKTFSQMNDIVSSTEQHAVPGTLMRVFPNPSGDFVVVSPEKSVVTTSFHYTIYDIAGKEVNPKSSGTWNQRIDMSSLIPGVYYMKIDVPGQSVPKILKIVKL